MKIVHGGDIYSHNNISEILDYSANINPLGMADKVKETIIKALPLCEAYPDPFCRRLTAKMADKLSIKGEEIIFGNGAADVLFRLIQFIKPKKALVLAPTFAEYEQALETTATNISYYPLKEQYGFDIREDILDYITSDMDMVFICNPNNPTGVITSKELMIKIVEKCHSVGAIAMIDQCFNDFILHGEEYSLIDVIDSYDNLFILGAFTKIYAIPGIRLGYGISSNREIIEGIYNSGQSWSVSTLAQEAGIAALDLDSGYTQETIELVEKQRNFLLEELEGLGFTCFNSKVNYILFKSSLGVDLKSQLEKHNILIRSCSNYKGLGDNYYRIAVKTHKDNIKLINTIKDIIG